MRKTILVSLAIVTVALAFIASYSAALRAPTPHEVPLAVAPGGPAQVVAKLDPPPALHARGVAAPRRAMGRREAYGALSATGGVFPPPPAPAASAAVATVLEDH